MKFILGINNLVFLRDELLKCFFRKNAFSGFLHMYLVES